MVIWRLSTDSQQNWGLDQTFNSVGFLVQSTATIDHGNSIVVDSLGRIVVAGISGPNMTVWQYKKDNTNQWGLDSDFNGSGYVSFPSGSGSAREILLDPQGRIYVTGTNNSGMGIWSYR